MKGDFKCPNYCQTLRKCAQIGSKYVRLVPATATCLPHEEVVGYHHPTVGCRGNRKYCEAKVAGDRAMDGAEQDGQ